MIAARCEIVVYRFSLGMEGGGVASRMPDMAVGAVARTPELLGVWYHDGKRLGYVDRTNTEVN